MLLLGWVQQASSSYVLQLPAILLDERSLDADAGQIHRGRQAAALCRHHDGLSLQNLDRPVLVLLLFGCVPSLGVRLQRHRRHAEASLQTDPGPGLWLLVLFRAVARVLSHPLLDQTARRHHQQAASEPGLQSAKQPGRESRREGASLGQSSWCRRSRVCLLLRPQRQNLFLFELQSLHGFSRNSIGISLACPFELCPELCGVCIIQERHPEGTPQGLETTLNLKMRQC